MESVTALRCSYRTGLDRKTATSRRCGCAAPAAALAAAGGFILPRAFVLFGAAECLEFAARADYVVIERPFGLQAQEADFLTLRLAVQDRPVGETGMKSGEKTRRSNGGPLI